MQDKNTDMTRAEELELIRKTLEKADLAFVSTLESGKIISRPLTIQKADNFNLWFLVQKDSSFVRDIGKNPTVNIAIHDKAYLSLSGKAKVITDLNTKADLWTKATEKFFGVEQTDPSIVAVHVLADTAEYWERDGFLKPLFKFLGNEAGDGEVEAGDRNKVEL